MVFYGSGKQGPAISFSDMPVCLLGHPNPLNAPDGAAFLRPSGRCSYIAQDIFIEPENPLTYFPRPGIIIVITGNGVCLSKR